MTQVSSTAPTCAAQWKMWLVKIFSVIYFTAVCAAQTTQNGTTVAGDVTPTNHPPVTTEITTVFEPPVPSLHRVSPWPDVFPSEKVEFSCDITDSSDWTITWEKDGQPLQDADPKVSAFGSKLTITAAAQTHSGKYSCKGHHKTKSGVTTKASIPVQLTVNANEPKPTLTRSPSYDKMFTGESVTFTCKVDVSSGWEYLWYHNDKEFPASKNNTLTIVSIDHPNSGQYHCKAKRGPFNTEKSDTKPLQVSDPPKPFLKRLSPWSDVFENETVELSCEIDSYDWVVTWYRNKEPLQVLEDMNLDVVDSFLNITEINQNYQGDYACKVHHESRKVSSGFSNEENVTVYENIPTPTVSKVPGFNPMYVGETVKLTCKVNVSSDWKYKWYKDGTELPANSVRLSLSDQGKYWCAASRGEVTSTKNSEGIPQDVLEIPVPRLEPITPWPDVFPTESVKLRCGMQSGSDWTYTWYKDGQPVKADNVASFDSNSATLSISSASAARKGEYTCRGHLKDRSVSSNSSSGQTLVVYDEKPRVTLKQDPEYKVMFLGESVTFSCHVNESNGWEFLWYKDTELLASGDNYTISSVKTTDTGSYTCKAQRVSDQAFLSDSSQALNIKVEGNKPKPLMTQQPNADKVYTGESVSFQCKVEHSSGWVYHWYKDEAKLPITNNSLTIHDANLTNSGTYSCMAIREKTMYNTEHSDPRILRISEIPVPRLEPITLWSDVFPTESVRLRCGMDGTSNWKYTWSKEGQKVQPDSAVSFDRDGATLSISSASTSHRGRYRCSAELKSRSVTSKFSSWRTLDVYDAKPKVTLIQNPEHNVMHTGDSVSFSCHINISSGWVYLWEKDGSSLPVSGDIHTISSVVRTNTGSYRCRVQRGNSTVFQSDKSQALRLDVEERPQADITLLTGWSEVFSTDSLVLRCGVQGSQDTWNYTWYKETLLISLPPSEKHTVTPQDDPDQSLYTCKGVRTGRPSYSKMSESYKTKNLLLKRRVLLSISGCIFFGIIAVFLGCIVLRVVRKPADDEDKPEEAELFLTMAQLKDRDDAPCPLVQYITDAEVNASSKEAEENGTICSETTPLPITPQEDPAVSESQDTTENNGGLVSFKQ